MLNMDTHGDTHTCTHTHTQGPLARCHKSSAAHFTDGHTEAGREATTYPEQQSQGPKSPNGLTTQRPWPREGQTPQLRAAAGARGHTAPRGPPSPTPAKALLALLESSGCQLGRRAGTTLKCSGQTGKEARGSLRRPAQSLSLSSPLPLEPRSNALSWLVAPGTQTTCGLTEAPTPSPAAALSLPAQPGLRLRSPHPQTGLCHL